GHEHEPGYAGSADTPSPHNDPPLEKVSARPLRYQPRLIRWPIHSSVSTSATASIMSSRPAIHQEGSPVSASQVAGMTLSCSMGAITPLLFSRQLMVCFQGQTLFSEPINSPVATAIVALRACSNKPDTMRAKRSNPPAHPAAKTARVNRSALRTAPRMVAYRPSRTRTKLPEIPGRIIAQIAMEPARKMN